MAVVTETTMNFSVGKRRNMFGVLKQEPDPNHTYKRQIKTCSKQLLQVIAAKSGSKNFRIIDTLVIADFGLINTSAKLFCCLLSLYLPAYNYVLYTKKN